MKPLNYEELLKHYQTKVENINLLIDKLQDKKIKSLSLNENGLILISLYNLRQDYECEIENVEKHILWENIDKTINDN